MCDLKTIYIPCEGVEILIKEVSLTFCSAHLSFYLGVSRLMRALDMQTCEQVIEALSKIPTNQKNVVSVRFGLDGHGAKTLETTGTKLHLSRERVRMLEHAAFTNISELTPKTLHSDS